jgi:hypothetical protein
MATRKRHPNRKAIISAAQALDPEIAGLNSIFSRPEKTAKRGGAPSPQIGRAARSRRIR